MVVFLKDLNFRREWMKKTLIFCKISSAEEIKILHQTLKQKQNEVKRYIQETKFALIISKKWFHEFESLDDCNISSSKGFQVSFKLGEEKVMVD